MKTSVVLLEHPRIESSEHYNDVANAPLSACLMSGYIAAVLKQIDVQVELYDAFLGGETFDQCYRRLAALNFNVLGVHAVYFWENTPELFTFLKMVRTARPDIYIVLYGFFPTFAYKEILSHYHFIDSVIIGEPEETFLDVIDCFKKNVNPAASAVQGLACRDHETIRLEKTRPLLEPLDKLPFPLRHRESLLKVGGSVLGSRGCYGKCTFCCINPFYGRKPCWRGRSPDNIRDEIEMLLPILEKKYIYFLDANFFGKGKKGKERAFQIAERIKDFSIEFGLESRSNDIDIKTTVALAEAGLRDVFLGIESASAKSLQRMNKNLTVDKTIQAITILRSCGIETTPGFIMFESDATLQDVRDNFDFLKTQGFLSKLGITANVLYHREIILSSMVQYARLDDEGRIKKKDFFAYEGCYRFNDPGVAFIADSMSIICRKILKIMDNSHSPVCWRSGEGNVSRKVNEYLVRYFEYILRKLELKEVKLDADEMLKYTDEALSYIEGLIVEERICQA